jgi:imidazole glycerol-phosphate synthase subunit HisH
VQSVALIDYGSGNLRSAEKALWEAARRAGKRRDIRLTRDPDFVRRADRVVLPGVGAFASCKAGLDAVPGMVGAMTEAVRERGRPFLGVCVGMQLLADRGLEFGETPGLGWIAGEVRKLEPEGDLPVPHMGWNEVTPARPHPLLPEGGTMYFANSFTFHPADPASAAASVDHGGRFTAMVAEDNVAGVQFHPEKSQGPGLDLLARFMSWNP